MPGTLYIVATPIGNLEDVTLRALRILREADRIACEDTRQSRKLLDHYQINRPLIALHEHNERERVDDLVAALEEGARLALISDAGTPLISDPGFRLVREARKRGIPVVPVPGPSAVLAALSASGLPTDSFYFGGFLPPKSHGRRAEFETRGKLPATLVYFEAPHRLLDCLADLAEILPDRAVTVARELTKIHEEFTSGTATEIAARLASRPDTVRGEVTLLIGKSESEPTVSDDAIREELSRLLDQGVSKSEAAREIAERHDLPRRHVYQLAVDSPRKQRC